MINKTPIIFKQSTEGRIGFKIPKSTTPERDASIPIGTWITSGFAPKRSFSISRS